MGRPGQFTILKSTLVNFYAAGIFFSAPVLAGFFAATFERRAPLLAAMTIAVGWGASILLISRLLFLVPNFHLNVGAPGRASSFMLVAVANLLWVTVACAIGALLRVARRHAGA